MRKKKVILIFRENICTTENRKRRKSLWKQEEKVRIFGFIDGLDYRRHYNYLFIYFFARDLLLLWIILHIIL